jgi:enamine deaminase RidA (YjgF/YER057c/UK114 family)
MLYICSDSLNMRRARMTQVVEKLNPDTLPDAPSMGYSQISICSPGRQIFISGQVAWQRDGTPVPENTIEQTKIAMENVKKALDAAGAKIENVTSVRLYLVQPSLNDFSVVGATLMPFFEGTKPTSTALGVTALGGDGLKVEIEVTAVV